MSIFMRYFIALLLACAILLPLMATWGSWGVDTERNAKMIQARSKGCPTHLKDAYGNCKRTHRSAYGRRSHYGGGPRGGK